MKVKIFLLIMMCTVTILLSGCGANKLDGDYTGKVSFLFIESKVTLHFEGNKVIQKDKNGQDIEGTYEISDNQLKMKLGDYKINAELSKDKNSFTITSAEGAVALAKGTEFKKEDK
ncbi:hypothetical protein BU019_11785 [Staphylococcus simulans]|uniref:hypothetical protein n=1 Tax=Staphylococcus simulans TaxID=1286 RepID=UPI000D1D87D0|nr:hypothetical protein [Staphylococcus simulans]PTI96430.1 hypothetical protein BU054_10740 [Staphylococcus simulans]PTJ49986.1 hypothetical protein BU019_11785 [Staphylococcus simulans]